MEITLEDHDLPLQVDDVSSLNTLMMDGGNEEVNEPLKITPLKTLIDTTKPGTYWILGEISYLENTPDWCYLGCIECNKKVIPDGSQFTCSGCDLRMPHGVYKFKVNVHVFDITGHASFMLWDRECKDILGGSALLLREMMLERKMDPNLFPEEQNHLIGRKGLFNVVVKSEGGSPHWNGPRSFGVRSFVSDPRILKKYEHVLDIVDDDSKEDVDLWNSLEDLSQKVEIVIGSNNLSSSQGEATSRRKMDAIDENDPVKRQLLDELSTTSKKKVKREHLEK
ncbi:unnamed protein product [Cuscuta campestris]|uniref:Replication factor A C-terminal domain-containing protein n=1 Tax=Cuscuta campestris TaxID=132261 RepID=A0A484N7G4_9ASTE|nr:unnamed protein product [Cuscuta campestris]